MTIQQDFPLTSYSDGVLTIVLTPPTPIGGRSIEFSMTKRFGGTPLVVKSVASGYNGMSGITILNSGTGIMSVVFTPQDQVSSGIGVSGVDAGNYAFRVRYLDTPASPLVEGYRIILP